eukprot:1155998-Pelagomonas_calceolata.AAC.2
MPFGSLDICTPGGRFLFLTVQLIRDINAGRFANGTTLVLVSLVPPSLPASIGVAWSCHPYPSHEVVPLDREPVHVRLQPP